jgi:hypothetical protein
MPAPVVFASLFKASEGARASVVGTESTEVASTMFRLAVALDALDERTDEESDLFHSKRALVLAGLATVSEVDAYRADRKAALTLITDLSSVVHARGEHLVEAALGLAAGSGLVAIGVLADDSVVAALTEGARKRHAPFVVVGATIDRRGPAADAVWLAGLQARFPAAPTSKPGSDLPTLEPWVDVLRSYAEVLRSSGRFAALRDAMPPPYAPSLAATSSLGKRIEEAAILLADILRSHPTLDFAARDPAALLAGLWLRSPAPPPAFMSYDAWNASLYVNEAMRDMSPAELATVLAHELVHVGDYSELAARVGLTAPAVGAVVHALPTIVQLGLDLHLEDRAYRTGVAVATSLRIPLMDRELALEVLSNASSSARDVLRASMTMHALARGDRTACGVASSFPVPASINADLECGPSATYRLSLSHSRIVSWGRPR